MQCAIVLFSKSNATKKQNGSQKISIRPVCKDFKQKRSKTHNDNTKVLKKKTYKFS